MATQKKSKASNEIINLQPFAAPHIIKNNGGRFFPLAARLEIVTPVILFL
jgi:hypothetical protein